MGKRITGCFRWQIDKHFYTRSKGMADPELSSRLLARFLVYLLNYVGIKNGNLINL